jgi:acetylornithine deacetylase/succinyl-diaminopimelate desuccinylase-like protein
VTDPLEHIRKLAEEIGPRASGSDSERLAAAYIATRLESFGFGVKTEEFRAPSSFSFMYLLAQAISLIGFVLAGLDQPSVGLLLAGVGLVAFVGENTTALHLAAALVPRGKSQNIVGRLVPRELPRRRIVISAHYDTAKAGLMFHPALVRSFRASFLALATAMLAVPLLVGLFATQHNRTFWLAAIPFAAVIAYSSLLLIHREIFYKYVPGANDNASGVAVTLSLAEALALDAPVDTEVMVVATGSEESGTWGMQAFLKRHGEDLARAPIINIDNVGGGAVCYTTREGMLLRHKTAKSLVDLADQIAATPGLAVTAKPFRTMSNDTEPALLRGVEAISVMALDRGVPVNWHQQTDNLANVDADSVDTAYRFVEAMVRRLIA